MVKSVAGELEDEQSDAATSSNIENLDVELDFVSIETVNHLKCVRSFTCMYTCTCSNNLS